MDASRYNSPSRKSRFRSQSGAPYRPTAPAEEPVPEHEEENPIYTEEEVYADPLAVEAEPLDALADPPPLDPYVAEPLSDEPPAEEDQLPAGLRLTRSVDSFPTRPEGVSAWGVVLASLLCLAVGVAGGYYLRSPAAAANSAPASAAPSGSTVPVLPLAPAVLDDVDAAFAATKQGQFADARLRFDALGDKHPNWPSMRIEAARATMYEHDFEAAGRILATIQRAGTNADAEFLNGLLNMTTQVYDKSDDAFARAIALDPARPDIFYFWGESLRRQGKPQQAAARFRQALARNQYETTEGLYQLKLWLSVIQSDDEAARDVNATIDADLASGHPSGPALFAAAARDLKAGRYAEAGEHIGQAQKVMEPAVFRVILQDPTFLQEDYRPELAPFYKP